MEVGNTYSVLDTNAKVLRCECSGIPQGSAARLDTLYTLSEIHILMGYGISKGDPLRQLA